MRLATALNPRGCLSSNSLQESWLTCVLAPLMIGFWCFCKLEISSTTSSDSDWLRTFSVVWCLFGFWLIRTPPASLAVQKIEATRVQELMTRLCKAESRKDTQSKGYLNCLEFRICIVLVTFEKREREMQITIITPNLQNYETGRTYSLAMHVLLWDRFRLWMSSFYFEVLTRFFRAF